MNLWGFFTWVIIRRKHNLTAVSLLTLQIGFHSQTVFLVGAGFDSPQRICALSLNPFPLEHMLISRMPAESFKSMMLDRKLAVVDLFMLTVAAVIRFSLYKGGSTGLCRSMQDVGSASFCKSWHVYYTTYLSVSYRLSVSPQVILNPQLTVRIKVGRVFTE